MKIYIPKIGSRQDKLEYDTETKIFKTGCFVGNIDEFEEAVNNRHSTSSVHYKDYNKIIKYIRKSENVFIIKSIFNKFMKTDPFKMILYSYILILSIFIILSIFANFNNKEIEETNITTQKDLQVEEQENKPINIKTPQEIGIENCLSIAEELHNKYLFDDSIPNMDLMAERCVVNHKWIYKYYNLLKE